MRLFAGAVPALALAQGAHELPAGIEIEAGPFTGTRKSLGAYRIPQWFADAKFGIWAHWGPQSAVEAGDWYARNMYQQGHPNYNYHVEHYGHPSKFGFKDTIPFWKAEKFDPAALMKLYKKAGAKYFMSMGVHHDNFDLWNSKHQRWNAVNMGPKMDIVGMWKKAAREEGLKFAVSEHLWITHNWFSTSHGSDQTGPLAGIPYDGADPKFADLYVDSDQVYRGDLPWMEDGIPEWWKRTWYARIKDLVDQYEPDLLYSDGSLPFEEYGLNLVAHHYNLSAKRNGGRVEVVYTSKRLEDAAQSIAVLDRERGVVDKIWPQPWQTDTCIGNWHYQRGMQVQDAEARGGHAGGYCEPQRESDAEFSAAGERHAGSGRVERAERGYGLDGGEQRSDSRDAAVEDFRRGPGDGSVGKGRPVQRERAQGFDDGGCALHHEGRRVVCVCDGVAGVSGGDQAAGVEDGAAGGDDSECRVAGV